MPNGENYTKDFFAWTAEQAENLQKVKQCECEFSTHLDIDLLVEEISDLGRSDVLRVQSLLRQALAHLIKISCDPNAQSVQHWEREVMTFILDAEDSYAPSYRQRIDIDKIWQKAQKEAVLALSQHQVELPMRSEVCPLDIDWLMSDEFEISEACKLVTEALLARNVSKP